jgi:hypothetical protein
LREIRFNCKPEEVDRLRQATLDAIASIDHPGVSDSHLHALRARYSARFPAAFHNDSFWLEELSRAYAEGFDPRGLLRLPALSTRINRDNLRRAARRYLLLDVYVDAVWSPGAVATRY